MDSFSQRIRRKWGRKNGTKRQCTTTNVSVHSAKTILKRSIQHHHLQIAKQSSHNKMWKVIDCLWQKNRNLFRKAAIATYCFSTGHDCLVAYLKNIYVHESGECTLGCESGTVMDKGHLLVCTKLGKDYRRSKIWVNFIGMVEKLMDSSSG